MHALLAEWQLDFPGDVVCAFDQIDDRNDIANAFAAIRTKDGLVRKGWVVSHACL
jgi:hypothetical protein